MSHTITGVAADFDPTVTFTETAPSDGDGLSAASIEDNATTPKTAEQATANAIEYFRRYGATNVKNTVATWTIVETFDDTLGAGHAQRRRYMGAAGLEAIADNASWDEGTGHWTADDATLASSLEAWGPSAIGSSHFFYWQVAGNIPWADNAWVKYLAVSNPVGTAACVEQFVPQAYGITGQANVQSTVGAAGIPIGYVVYGSTQTTDAATVHKPISFTVPTNKAAQFTTTITGYDSGHTAMVAGFSVDAARNAAGTLTQCAGVPQILGAAFLDEIGITSAGWAVNGTAYEFQIHGKAATTINWTVKVEIAIIG